MKRLVYVTGAGRGIGKAIVHRMFDAGYSVIFTYNSNSAVAEAVAAVAVDFERERAAFTRFYLHRFGGLAVSIVIGDINKITKLRYRLIEIWQQLIVLYL